MDSAAGGCVTYVIFLTLAISFTSFTSFSIEPYTVTFYFFSFKKNKIHRDIWSVCDNALLFFLLVSMNRSYFIWERTSLIQ